MTVETQEKKIITTYEPQPIQLEFHASPVRNKLYGGAMGGGKTRTLCEDINSLMIEYSGNRGLLIRKVLADFKMTTYLMLVEKTLVELIEAGLVVENKSDKYFNYWNGSRLFYGGLESDSPDSQRERKKYFSAEYGVIGIDEAREIMEKDFDGLSTRLRHRLPSVGKNKLGEFPPFFMLLASNPSQNWLKTKFISSPDPDSFIFFPALPKDNGYNPADYDSQLRRIFKHDPKGLEAYVNGNWDSITSIDDLLQMSDIEPIIDKDLKSKPLPFCGRITSCDSARFGDDMTRIYDWGGTQVVGGETYGKKDVMETVGRIMFHALKNKSTVIAIDPIPMPGLGDRLREVISEAELNIMVIGVDFREKSSDPNQWFNLRAEVYWNARNLIKEKKCSCPDDPRLHGQLCSIKFKFIGGGKLGTRIKIESKEDIKKRLGFSPDDADAYVIGLWVQRYAVVNKKKGWRDTYKQNVQAGQSHMSA